MNTFNESFSEWWKRVEEEMREQYANDGVDLHAMRNIAEQSWNTAIIGAAKTVLGRIKETDLAANKAEEEQDVKNAIYLRLVTFDLWLTVGEIKELKSD